MTQPDPPLINTPYVIAVVAERSGFSTSQILMRDRRQPLTSVRHVAMLLARERFPDISFTKIGRHFGGRDHSTVINGIRKARYLVNSSAQRFHEIRSLYWRAKEEIG